jgi:hypothetical protein
LGELLGVSVVSPGVLRLARRESRPVASRQQGNPRGAVGPRGVSVSRNRDGHLSPNGTSDATRAARGGRTRHMESHRAGAACRATARPPPRMFHVKHPPPALLPDLSFPTSLCASPHGRSQLNMLTGTEGRAGGLLGGGIPGRLVQSVPKNAPLSSRFAGGLRGTGAGAIISRTARRRRSEGPSMGATGTARSR